MCPWHMFIIICEWKTLPTVPQQENVVDGDRRKSAHRRSIIVEMLLDVMLPICVANCRVRLSASGALKSEGCVV